MSRNITLDLVRNWVPADQRVNRPAVSAPVVVAPVAVRKSVASTSTVGRNQGSDVAALSNFGKKSSVPATDKQIEFINKLRGEKVCDTQAALPVSKQEASDHISWLLSQPRAAVAPVAPKARREITEGGYIANGVIYTVRKTRNGLGFNVKTYSADTQEMEYVGGIGALPLDARPVTKEEAVKYNTETVHCCICGAHLTAKDSKDAGIGPICSSRMGW